MTALSAYAAFGHLRQVALDHDAEAARDAMLEYAYREFAPALLGYFRSHGMTGAEDLVGEVFVSVARNLCAFRGDVDDLRRWVFTIARRRRADHIRGLVLRRRLVIGDPPDEEAAPCSEDIDVDLVAALRRLTLLQRDVVVLRFVADLSIDDVARVLRRNATAVKALQARALAQLAHHLRDC